MGKKRERIEAITEFDGDEAGFEVKTTEQVIRLAINNLSSCCESWGYFWCNDKPQDFVGAIVHGISLTDTALNTKTIADKGADERADGDIMFVNIDTNKGVLQFVAYNSHNGYYGHTATIESKQLKHSKCL